MLFVTLFVFVIFPLFVPLSYGFALYSKIRILWKRIALAIVVAFITSKIHLIMGTIGLWGFPFYETSFNFSVETSIKVLIWVLTNFYLSLIIFIANLAFLYLGFLLKLIIKSKRVRGIYQLFAFTETKR